MFDSQKTMCNDVFEPEGNMGLNYHQNKNIFTVDGAKLTHARIRSNYSLQDVADACGCNKSQVSRWETGELNPSEERVLKMVELFGRHDFVVVNATEWYWREKFGEAEGKDEQQ